MPTPPAQASPEPERASLGPISATRNGAGGHAPPKPSAWRHACGSLERGPRADGTIVCDGCAEPVGTVRELAPGVVETVRVGASGAAETIIGRDASLPAVDKDVTGYRPCCRSEGILRQRGGVWTCADCRTEVTA